MSERKLFQAISDGNIVHIDKSVEKKGLFLCPHCKQEVIPKCGEKNVWHFAHKGETCLESKGVLDDGLNKEITIDATKSLSEIEVPEDPTYFMCMKCHKKERKELGIKYSEKEYICRSCFNLS